MRHFSWIFNGLTCGLFLGAALTAACGGAPGDAQLQIEGLEDRGSARSSVLDGSCVGHCGSKSGQQCWCDAECASYGDCCEDYAKACLTPLSCAGMCGGAVNRGECWCDAECEAYGDCCEDKAELCDACGNGAVDEGEACDIGIVDGEAGACPSSCDDNDACTADDLSGEACQAVCGHAAIEACLPGDGCCPAGCRAPEDDDCALEEEGQTATGGEQCFADNTGGYLYHYLDLEPPFTADGLLLIRHRGFNPYGPRPYEIELETSPDHWSVVATTSRTQGTTQEERVILPAELLNGAYAATGWLRFRNSNVYTGPTGNCVQLTLTVNCASCLACPEGSVDLGAGCQPVDEPYVFAPVGGTPACGGQQQHRFLGVPEAQEAATLRFGWAVCDGGTAEVAVAVNGSWQPLTTASTTSSCGFQSTELVVPRSLLNAAIDASHTVTIKFSFEDNCVAGMGCATLNDPCMRDLSLTVQR